MRPIFLGLDCGGSSSRAIAIDAEGSMVHQGHAGPANLASTPLYRLRQNLAHALRGCPTPDAVCGCFAGLLTEEDRLRAAELVSELVPAAHVSAQPDYAAAFFASEPGTDLCVIAGTGSLVCSWDGTKMIKSGGRGYLLGDEGSAFRYGRDALLWYLDHSKSASETLIKSVEQLFETGEEAAVVSRLYRSPSPQAVLARLAKALASDARAGIEYALKSIEKNGGQLANIMVAHVRKHLPGRHVVNVSLAGGLWKTSSVFAEALNRRLREQEIEFRLDRIKTPPVYGAVRLAQEMVNGD